MTKNKKRKMHIKKGDLVKIITGNEKGKTGKVIRILPKTSKVIIENINIRIKHVKPSQNTDTGKIIKLEVPIHSSNVILYDKTSATKNF